MEIEVLNKRWRSGLCTCMKKERGEMEGKNYLMWSSHCHTVSLWTLRWWWNRNFQCLFHIQQCKITSDIELASCNNFSVKEEIKRELSFFGENYIIFKIENLKLYFMTFTSLLFYKLKEVKKNLSFTYQRLEYRKGMKIYIKIKLIEIWMLFLQCCLLRWLRMPKRA